MKKVFFLFFLAVFCLFAPAAFATTVFSPIIEMEVSPGQKEPGVLRVYNETAGNLFLKASLESFAANGESGEPKYIPIEEKNSYLNWFKLSSDALVLKSHQVVMVPFTVEVPKNATPGGYYAVVFWQTDASLPGAQNTIGVASRVGTLILLKVKGTVDEKGELLDFKTIPQKNIFWSLPIKFYIRFQNLGNVHLKPVGEITLTNFFGQKKSLPVNGQNGNILPQSTRRFEIVWGDNLTGNWLIDFYNGLKQEIKDLPAGKYQAKLFLSYGTGTQTNIEKDFSFWVIPYRLIVLLIIIIAAVIIFASVNKKIKKVKAGGLQKN